jgi:N-acetylmuramic acid 6-phosphate etherase
MSILELLENMNKEDKSVPETIQNILPDIEVLINKIVSNMKNGGRLFYIGCGTSGRLGILDASECPPTFGVSENKVIGIISGGDVAIRKAVEFAEDSESEGWEDLKKYNINTTDIVIGIAASGSTPYVVSTIKKCNQKGISTGCITCNDESPLAKNAQFPIKALVGPEFVTGSTRMKAGTAQKLILNMISTSTMIKLGHVQGNKMVDMQLSNDKLVDRGTNMIMERTSLDYEAAKKLLLKYGSVRKAVDSLS